MSDVRDEVYEIFNEVGLFFVIACTSLLGAMGGTTYRNVRRVFVWIISIGRPSMPEVSPGTVATVFTTITGVVGYAANTTWVIDRFKPVNQTLAREQVHEGRKEKFISYIADWFEKNWKDTGDAVYLLVHAVWDAANKVVNAVWFAVGIFLTKVGESFYNKMFGKPVAVVETAVASPPKKTARNKSPARKSNRTR